MENRRFCLSYKKIKEHYDIPGDRYRKSIKNDNTTATPINKNSWNLITNIEDYNQNLNLNNTTFPLPEDGLPQYKYVDYSPGELFELYFTPELCQNIVAYTNHKLEKFRKSVRYQYLKREHLKLRYVNVTINEFKVFLGMKLYFNFSNKANRKGNFTKI